MNTFANEWNILNSQNSSGISFSVYLINKFLNISLKYCFDHPWKVLTVKRSKRWTVYGKGHIKPYTYLNSLIHNAPWKKVMFRDLTFSLLVLAEVREGRDVIYVRIKLNCRTFNVLLNCGKYRAHASLIDCVWNCAGHQSSSFFFAIRFSLISRYNFAYHITWNIKVIIYFKSVCLLMWIKLLILYEKSIWNWNNCLYNNKCIVS